MTLVRLAAATAVAGASLLAAPAQAHGHCPTSPPAVWRVCSAMGDPRDMECWYEPDTGRIYCRW